MSQFSLRTLLLAVTLCGILLGGTRLLMLYPVYLGIPIFLGFFASFVFVLEHTTQVRSPALRLSIIIAFPVVFLVVIGLFSIFVLQMHQQHFR